MSIKKIVSTFALTAVLSVFSCFGTFLWSEFSTHVLAKNELCSAEKHCIDDCVICDVSQQVVTLDKILPDEDETAESLESPFSPEMPSAGVLVFDIPVKKLILSSLSPPQTESFTYYSPHKIVEDIVLII